MVNQTSFVSLAKFLWVVLSVSLWVYFGGELIYHLNYWVFSLSHKPENIKYIYPAYRHFSYRLSLGCSLRIWYQLALPRIKHLNGLLRHNSMDSKQAKQHCPQLIRNKAMKKEMMHWFSICLHIQYQSIIIILLIIYKKNLTQSNRSWKNATLG